MASLSPAGERGALALIVEQYAQIVDLREALAAERNGRAADQERHARELQELSAAKP